MVTAAGLTYRSTCAAFRARIQPFRETRFRCQDETDEVITGALVDLVTEGAFGVDRLVKMMTHALREAILRAPDLALERIPILLGIAEQGGPGIRANCADEIIPALERAIGTKLHPDSRVLPAGKTSLAVSLMTARESFDYHQHPRVFLIAVDSYLDSEVLDHYEALMRVKTESNPDGFIPGEAAAALLIEFHSPDRTMPGAFLYGVGLAEEPAQILSEQPLRAEGMRKAIQAALTDAGISFGQLAFRLSDVSGERYGFRELSLAMSRTYRCSQPRFDLWHSADCIGEVGAAAGHCLIGLGADAINRRYAPGPLALCLLSADSGQRGALIMGLPPRREP